MKLRNDLVHHFINLHDLWSVEGCRQAQETLIAAYGRIDACYGRLIEWAKDLDRMNLFMADYMRSDEFRDFVVKGRTPDRKMQ